MKKSGWILLIVLFGLMAITNPNKNDYISWVKEKAVEKSQDSLEKGLISVFGNPIFDSTTTSTNYVFFSRYSTELDSKHKVKAIGVFKNFIPISFTD
ncbi:DUF4359 domain-containing protein [Tumebacillus flagellatus]|uniref:DUF4359 domain-containing protein n=1 Tax=Tumebacillus flagellatus TaxID=1157490 RepID=A0A074LLI5_9BACL|nr:DUF4359 domain-containing protein [Tumebacillus flagellatus]KEO81425.1 hypothetical protein EL26_21055 [Tumebacillus flagellatus]